MWIGGTARHSFTGASYALSTGGSACVVLSFANSVINDFLNMDLHCENTTLTSIFKITGASTPTLYSFRYRDHQPFQSGPIFKRDAGVTSVTLNDAELHVGTLSGTSPSWFDTPASFSVNGYVYSRDNTWTTPGSFSGVVCTPTCVPTFASYGNISAGTVGASTVNANAVNAASVGNPGNLSTIVVNAPTGGNANNWNSSTLAGNLPTLNVNSSNGAGSGATASLGNIIMYGAPTPVGGVGCTNGDTFNLNDPQSGGGLLGGGQAYFTATSVSGGAVTAWSLTQTSGNAFNWLKPMSASTNITARSSTCTVLPTLSQANGYPSAVWALSNGVASIKSTINVTAAGSGYTATPTISFTPTYNNTFTGGQNLAITLTSSFSLGAGSGGLTFDNNGNTFTGPAFFGSGIGSSSSPTNPFYAKALISAGTAPTTTTGTCTTLGSATGGPTAGKFATTASCGSGTTIVLSNLPTATNGYACAANDNTTPTTLLTQTAYSTTSATMKTSAATC